MNGDLTVNAAIGNKPEREHANITTSLAMSLSNALERTMKHDHVLDIPDNLVTVNSLINST